MMAGPQLYVEYLTREGYHPRSLRHGDQLARLVLRDLLASSRPLRDAAGRGDLVFATNFDVYVADPSTATSLSERVLKDLAWNIDLVLGPPSPQVRRQAQVEEGTIQKGFPEDIWMALDAKGVMTEHGKARRNRQRDVTALSAVMHLFHSRVVVGAVVPINIARKFKSPLRDDITDHGGRVDRTVTETLSIFRAVRQIGSSVERGGIEGLGCFVIDYANTPGSQARLHLAPPAPQENDIIHYDRFIHDLSAALNQRFGGEI